MTPVLETIGDAMTGSILGRAVEPLHGEDRAGSDGLTHEHHCLNCRATLVGHFCHACGQHAHVHRTLMAFVHDIAHGVFHFEGKVWRTLPMLISRPGALTRRYIHGERARFVSPLALFLFCVFLMFATFESVGGPATHTVSRNGRPVSVAEAASGESPRVAARVAALERRRASAVAARQPTADIDAQLVKARSHQDALQAVQSMTTGTTHLAHSLNIDTGSPQLDARLRHALENPELLIYKLQSSAYKFAWALIPLSLPFMWAMFAWRRQYKLYDHAVFVTYSLSFVILLLIMLALLGAAGASASWLFLAIPVHFFVQLRGAYLLSIFSATWRTIALLFVSGMTLTAFGALLLRLGLGD